MAVPTNGTVNPEDIIVKWTILTGFDNLGRDVL
jgi:hypothetical protein